MRSKKDRPQRKITFAQMGTWARSIGYFGTMGFFATSITILGPALPDLAELVGTSISDLSILFSIRPLGFLIGSLFAGWVFDKQEGHIYLAVSFLLLSLYFAFVPLNPTFWVLVLMTAAQGICNGIVVTGASTFIVWEHEDNPQPWVNTQSFINGLGGFSAPLILTFAYARFGEFSQAFWILALFAIFLAILFFFINSPKIRAQKKPEDGGGRNPKAAVILMTSLFLLYVGTEVSLNSWVFTLATSAYGIPAENARLLNSLFWGAIALGRVVNIVLSSRIEPGRQLLISFIGSAVSSAAILIFRSSAAVLWAGVILTGWFFAFVFPSLMLYAEKKLSVSGKLSGIFFSATSVGSMILPFIAGQLLAVFNVHAMLWVVLAGIAAMNIIFLNLQTRLANRETSR